MDGVTSTQGTITKISQDDYLLTWLEAFLLDRRVQQMSSGTLSFYQKKLRLFSHFCEGQVITQVSQISPDTLRRYLLWLEQTGHNPGGVHCCYRALRAFLRWFWEEAEPEGRNPIERVKSPKLATEPLDPADINDLRAMLDICKGDFHGVRDRAAILFLLDTGSRAAEFLALNLADVDPVTSGALIRQGKGRKPRTVYMGKNTRKALRAYLKLRQNKNDGLWVTDTGERLTYWGLRSMVERRAKQAHIVPPPLHSFRRAFALAMLRAGVDVYSLQELMGHADLQVLRRYLKQTNEDLRAAHRQGSPADKI